MSLKLNVENLKGSENILNALYSWPIMSVCGRANWEVEDKETHSSLVWVTGLGWFSEENS